MYLFNVFYLILLTPIILEWISWNKWFRYTFIEWLEVSWEYLHQAICILMIEFNFWFQLPFFHFFDVHFWLQIFFILPVTACLVSMYILFVGMVSSTWFSKCIRICFGSASRSATVMQLFSIIAGTIEHFYNRTGSNEWQSSFRRYCCPRLILSINILIA